MTNPDSALGSENDTSVRALLSDVRTKPARNLVFAAPADDPRARRPVDVARLVVAAIIILVTSESYRNGNEFDQRMAEFFGEDLPSWISAPFTIVFILGGVYSGLLLISILLFGTGRRAVARDMFLAGLLASALAMGVSQLTGPEWPDWLPELYEREGVPSFPVFRLALAAALIRVAHPYLSAPMRHLGGRLLGGMMAASLLLGYGSVTSIIGGLALGIGTAAAVHLVFGSGIGIPSRARIIDALASLGVEVLDIEFLPEQPVGETLVRADLPDDGRLLVKIYGRDAVDAAFAVRAWRAMWYRDSHRPVAATGLQQVEHEGLLLLDAHRKGAAVPELVAWGPGDAGDALLVVRGGQSGERFESLDPAEIGDDTLHQCWEALAGLHRAGIVHRDIDSQRVVVLEDRVVLTDLSGAAVSFDPSVRSADVAQMLVTTAVQVGPERAIAVARRVLGDPELGAALPLVQTSALSTALRGEVKAGGLKLKSLRETAIEAVGIEAPPLAQLVRVTWGNVAMVALTAFAVSALIGALADIGFDTIADEVANASWTWIITALVLSQLTNVGEWISLTGFVPRVPFWPTLKFRYAIAFISLAVPSDAGSIAMNIRFMQKQGVAWAAAVAQGPLLTIFTKAFDIILLVLSAKVIGETVNLDDVDSGPVLRIIVLVVVLVVVGAAVAFAVPKLRHMVLPPLKEGLAAIRDSVTDPRRLARVASGTLLQRLLFALTLAAAAQAFGGSEIGFTEALFINSIVSLFLGFMPVPGGVGVGEAALAAGLTALGMGEAPALAAAVTHRMVTTYLPPIYGWYTSRWLAENDYL
ncbi:MAG: hypothetical protein GY745_11650 [Actinomycetia bacterium]|nr:hypothetical protein [Actinomycetes bacterium]